MQITAEDIISRLKSALKIKTDAQLAALMNISAPTISTWKARNSVDHAGIIAICKEKGVDLNLVFGDENNKTQTSVVNEPSESYIRNKDELLIQSLSRTIDLLEDRLSKTEKLLEEVQHQLKEARDRISALTQKRAG